MPNALSLQLQDQIVASIAASIPEQWDAAVVNIEIDVVDGDQSENCLCVSYNRDVNLWNECSFKLPYECYDLFSELRLAMADSSPEKWSVCTLEMDASGKYRYSFSYESPRRSNGNFDDDSMFKNYVPPSL